MNFIKYFDVYGKYVTFYYGSSTYHKTTFGGFLSILSFCLIMTVTTTSLYNLFYQKPTVNSNIVFFINKKFTQLEAMEIRGNIINKNESTNQFDEFFKYYRIVLYEKYFDEMEQYTVAKLTKIKNNKYKFNVELGISDVFKEKEFSFLKIISCENLLNNQYVIWPKDDNFTSECSPSLNNYLENDDFPEHNFYFSFETPIYTLDRKGNLQKVPHETELHFSLKKNKKLSYSLDTKYVVVEDNSNIYYSKKQYNAYFTMKHPLLIKEETDVFNKGFSLDINIRNKDSDQIILITIYKKKLLEVLAKLGGLMKIITLVRMTTKFWLNFLYEKTLYDLLVKRKNPYLDQKRDLLETSVYRNTFKKMNNIRMNTEKTTENDTSSVKSPTSVNVNYSISTYNYNSNRGPFALPDKKDKNSAYFYSTYWAWLLNKFCNIFYNNKDAKRKRLMITDTLGLSNYILHLDYIDRQIILEQQTGEINSKIQNIINRSREMDEKENVEINLDVDKLKTSHFSSKELEIAQESKETTKGLVEEE